MAGDTAGTFLHSSQNRNEKWTNYPQNTEENQTFKYVFSSSTITSKWFNLDERQHKLI